MQTIYAVYGSDPAGQKVREGEVSGSIRQRDHGWEMVTRDGVIVGTLTGHPLAAHVFTDHAGREYRVV